MPDPPSIVPRLTWALSLYNSLLCVANANFYFDLAQSEDAIQSTDWLCIKSAASHQL